jgi:hypothetical protein
MRHSGNWFVIGFITISIVFAMFIQMAVAEAWAPPIGIPVPRFGINEMAPARPNPWNTEVPGFYYVCRDCPGATDSGRSYGTPSLPRATIPSPLPAGAMVELHGVYDKGHDPVVCNGTATRPVFIRGQSSSAKPIIKQPWRTQGTYYILENLKFADRDGTTAGKIYILSPTNYAALRYCEVSGNLKAGGAGVLSWNTSTASNVVIFNNNIHDNGDVNATFDQDIHGISVSARVNNLWVVDNEISRNSGDGIQINAGNLTNQPTTHHIYVGGNTSHGNKQSGMWTKQAVDVIFSQNTIYNHRPSGSSGGAGTGYQYAPDYVWFLFNHIYNCEGGIGAGSDSGMGSGKEIFVVGNLIHNIHPTRTWDPNNSWSPTAIMLAGGLNRRIVNNTIWDYSGGIYTPGGGYIHIENNIIGGRTDSLGRDIYVSVANTANASKMNNNVLYSPTVRIQWGSSKIYDLAGFYSATKKGQYCLNQNPQFVNKTASDYHLSSISPAIDKGIAKDVYTIFLNRYGINISKDFDETPRPQGSNWDIGAFEFGLTSPGPSPTD